jgi:hypothetical protein
MPQGLPAPLGSGLSTIMAFAVRITPAADAAFCSEVRRAQGLLDHAQFARPEV